MARLRMSRAAEVARSADCAHRPGRVRSRDLTAVGALSWLPGPAALAVERCALVAAALPDAPAYDAGIGPAMGVALAAAIRMAVLAAHDDLRVSPAVSAASFWCGVTGPTYRTVWGVDGVGSGPSAAGAGDHVGARPTEVGAVLAASVRRALLAAASADAVCGRVCAIAWTTQGTLICSAGNRPLMAAAPTGRGSGVPGALLALTPVRCAVPQRYVGTTATDARWHRDIMARRREDAQ